MMTLSRWLAAGAVALVVAVNLAAAQDCPCCEGQCPAPRPASVQRSIEYDPWTTGSRVTCSPGAQAGCGCDQPGCPTECSPACCASCCAANCCARACLLSMHSGLCVLNVLDLCPAMRSAVVQGRCSSSPQATIVTTRECAPCTGVFRMMTVCQPTMHCTGLPVPMASPAAQVCPIPFGFAVRYQPASCGMPPAAPLAEPIPAPVANPPCSRNPFTCTTPPGTCVSAPSSWAPVQAAQPAPAWSGPNPAQCPTSTATICRPPSVTLAPPPVVTCPLGQPCWNQVQMPAPPCWSQPPMPPCMVERISPPCCVPPVPCYPPVCYVPGPPPPATTTLWSAVVAKGQVQVSIQACDTTTLTCKETTLTIKEGEALKLHVEDDQIQVSGKGFEASADRVSRSGKGDSIVLEGHVHLEYARGARHGELEADAITVDLSTGQMQVKLEGTPADNDAADEDDDAACSLDWLSRCTVGPAGCVLNSVFGDSSAPLLKLPLECLGFID